MYCAGGAVFTISYPGTKAVWCSRGADGRTTGPDPMTGHARIGQPKQGYVFWRWQATLSLQKRERRWVTHRMVQPNCIASQADSTIWFCNNFCQLWCIWHSKNWRAYRKTGEGLIYHQKPGEKLPLPPPMAYSSTECYHSGYTEPCPLSSDW